MTKNRKNLRGSLVAVAVAGAATFMAASPAHAYVMATSILNMQNFQITGTFGDETRALDDSDFSFLTYTTTADTEGSLSGSGSFSFSETSDPTNPPIDIPYTCIGTGCGALGVTENGFEQVFALPVGNYAAADQFESGAPISGVGAGELTLPLGADVKNSAYVGITDITADGSAGANNNLNSSFIFELDQAAGVTFSFDMSALLQVAMSSDEQFPGFATASYGMNFTILDLTAGGTTVFQFTPDLFGDGVKTLSLNAPIPVNLETIRTTGGFQSFSSGTAALSADTLYQASFRMNVNADAGRLEVPEPASLALIGLGLLGLGGVRRLQRKGA